MTAKFIQIGESAHDAERQALRFLVEGLPETFTVYGNAWLVERSGVVYELDAVVVAPHAIFVVEVKSYRGRIEGTDNDWWLPEKIRSPLKLNRLTSQVLKSHLRNASYQAGQVWTEGLVFLSATTDVGVRGPASNDRVHTRKTILAALQDQALIERLSQGRAWSQASLAERELLELFTGAQSGPRPVRRVREYEVVETLDHHDTFTELLGRNTLSGAERVLRIYSTPPLAPQAQRDRIAERARWEAQVLGRLGRSEGVLSADPPFSDEAGIVLPLEHFKGITLTTWVERYGPDARGKERADLRIRTDLWMRIAQTIDEVHRQGVVHRLLRPDVILVEDKQEPTEVRVTGFDLAKQMTSEATISLSTIHDDRLVNAAPEVVAAFSSAEPASDQFSLGAILALILTGKPLFENTRQLMAARRLMRRVRDISQRIPLSLDEAVTRMVELRATDRYPSLAEAIEAVRIGRDPTPRVQTALPNVGRVPLDAENLQPGTRIGTDYEVITRLGQGGMAVVYAARHLVSGRTRALKIARTDDTAEDALRGEYDALTKLDHPNIVRVIDLTKMVEGRLTLVMERVSGVNLRQWLAQHPAPEPNAQRRLAEDLIAGLDYLEQKSVTHKDLKPDNLLVSDGQLTIIDFSLAAMPEDAAYGGTALYRDPASARWTHATDRFAAALCLFELYAGRHAFEGRVPEPGQAPSVSDDDIQPTGLAAFFRKALDPVPEKRFPSARAMRDALLVALGEDAAPSSSAPPPKQIDATTPLRIADLTSAFDAVVDGFGGIVRLDEIGQRFESEWPAGVVTGEGIVRLIVRTSAGRTQLLDLDEAKAPLVVRPIFDRDVVRSFLARTDNLAQNWPPLEPDAVRRALAATLPQYQGDHLSLAVRTAANTAFTHSGHLYVPPLDPALTFGFVLGKLRSALTLTELVEAVRAEFGPETRLPETGELLSLLTSLDYRLSGEHVVAGGAGSVVASPALAADDLPSALGAERSPELVVRDMLKGAARSRGFRMLVTPPERHAEVGRSVAAALSGQWVSFDDAFFTEHGSEMAALERAERFVAQREALTEAAEQTLFNLLQEHGRPGNVIVLGDTALLGLCESLDLPRRLYDETLSGSRGFWVLVVPGVIHNRQPRFNEGPAMWHLEGATLPLLNPLPDQGLPQ